VAISVTTIPAASYAGDAFASGALDLALDAVSHRIPVQSGSAAGKQQNRHEFWMRNLRGIENQEV
jgi:hypothetical protein